MSVCFVTRKSSLACRKLGAGATGIPNRASSQTCVLCGQSNSSALMYILNPSNTKFQR
jgi:hypothetical protein